MQTTEVGQNSEIKQVIGSLCMMNNRFMNFMLDDNKKAAQVFLRVILGDDKIKVRNVRIQSFIQNIYGHSSQLDILAQDSKGRYFNVEVQRSDEGAPARRARFYSSILDTHFLQPSKLYEELPDTYVIFITENDVLRDNLPLYDIRRTIKQSARDFEDGSHIIYVNSQRRDDTALGKLMQDLYCTEPKNLHYQEFAERMEFLKYSKEGEAKMTDVIEEYAAKKAEAVAKEAAKKTAQARNVELAKDLLSEGESIERTVRLSKLSEAEVRELASKLSAYYNNTAPRYGRIGELFLVCKLLANNKGQRVIDELVQADTLTFGFFGQQAVQCFRYTHYEPATKARLHIRLVDGHTTVEHIFKPETFYLQDIFVCFLKGFAITPTTGEQGNAGKVTAAFIFGNNADFNRIV